jgi:hypothetical protein
METTANEFRRGQIKRVYAINPALLILFAPVVFLAHILEEAPAFTQWLNTITFPPVPEGSFLAANWPTLLITAILAVAAASLPYKAPALTLLVWLSYFMFANTLFHIAATLALRRYCPGLITSVGLYLPYFFWFTAYVKFRFQTRNRVIAGAAAGSTLLVYLEWHRVILDAALR